MKKEGGCEWYQSMGHIFLYISANFLLFFKGHWPFKSEKTLISGLTTQYAPRLNRGLSAAKKHYSVAIPGSSYPLLSSIPGGLFQNRNYEKNLPGVGR
jgi:hypothetical protein